MEGVMEGQKGSSGSYKCSKAGSPALCTMIVVSIVRAIILLWCVCGSHTDPTTLRFLFDRPGEPVFNPKGDHGQLLFKVPPEFLIERYRPLAATIGSRSESAAGANATVVTVTKVKFPDINFAMQLGRHENFSPFLPYHRQMADSLLNIILGIQDFQQLLSTLVYCKDRINPFLFLHVLSVVILHRPDLQQVNLPNLCETFPEKFFDNSVFQRLREEANLLRKTDREPIDIPQNYTASDLNPEHRLAYFREDVGINLHHWQWHLWYPNSGQDKLVAKDRRGELFYYMHQQILARYNFERLAAHLQRVVRYHDLRHHMEGGYYPKLDSLVASRGWPGRPDAAILRDINRPEQKLSFDIQDLERWRERILGAINVGYLVHEDGGKVNLSASTGTDLLGDVVESTVLSVNQRFYGDLHNMGHMAVAYCHDPDNRHGEPFGVMGDSGTAMRDPMFYRWHAFINDIFVEHKATLSPYTVQQLQFSGVRVTSVSVAPQGGGSADTFITFWQQSNVDLSSGLDFAPRGPLVVRVTHLQHVPFMYDIQVENSGVPRTGTVRIFLAPTLDERGVPLAFQDQRLLFIELDKFQIHMKKGRTTFKRRSTDSAVTIPYERTFNGLNNNRQNSSGPAEQSCDCGWPHHMLIPKGDASGMRAQLFVMVSNYAEDKVPQQQEVSNKCTSGHSYCGVRGHTYPDHRPMGFPFDRPPPKGVVTIEKFLTSNMAVKDTIIRFVDKVVVGRTDRVD